MLLRLKPLERPRPSLALALSLMVAATIAFSALLGCGSPPMPKGPGPEYEEPPAPSWLDAGAAADPSQTGASNSTTMMPGAAGPADASAGADAR